MEVHLDRIDVDVRTRDLRVDFEREPFVRLNADGQHVGRERIGRVGVEQDRRHVFQLHRNLAGTLGQLLPGAEEERHARPSPVVDEDPERHERFSARVRLDTGFFEIAGVLPPDDRGIGRCGLDRSHRLQHLELFVAHDIGRQRMWRLHRDQSQELQQVVLHHVSQRASLFVVAGTRANPFFLGDRNLHVIDVTLVHQRLEDAVREAKHQHVLNRFLTEVVIDAVNLLLVEHFRDRVVDDTRALEVAADRFLDDDACERLGTFRRARHQA
jgi:hypothetical protein